MFFWHLFVTILYLAPFALCVGMISKWGIGFLFALVRYPVKRFGWQAPTFLGKWWVASVDPLLRRANRFVGELEYVVAVPRNTTIGLGYAVFLLYLVVTSFLTGT